MRRSDCLPTPRYVISRLPSVNGASYAPAGEVNVRRERRALPTDVVIELANVVAAVRRYCDLGLRRANREHDLIWRQGMRSLLSGSLLFFVGIALSFAFTRPGTGEFANDLIGSGVFLVIAWVGLWYPLDLLFIAREQAKREISVLGKMLTLPVIVRAHDHTLPAVTVPASPVSRGLPLSLEARFRRFRGPSKSGI